MKRRVTLRVESLDGRILPNGSSGAIDLEPPAAPGLGSKPGGVGDGIQGFWSKPGGTGEGIQSLGIPGAANPGTSATDGMRICISN
jgi:hypothetical protein